MENNIINSELPEFSRQPAQACPEPLARLGRAKRRGGICGEPTTLRLAWAAQCNGKRPNPNGHSGIRT